MTKTDKQTVPKRQVVFIEFLRIVACFLVIVNHTNSRIFRNTEPSFLWFISLVYFFVSKIAVPVFIMISGYTMLDREDSYQKALSRVVRIASSLLLFSGMYYVHDQMIGEIEALSLKSFVALIIKRPLTNAYWYLYLYLGILIMLPFLQKMVANMKKRDFHAFFLISGGIFGVWPIIVHYIPELEYSGYFELPIFGSHIWMLLIGCYFKRYCHFSKKDGVISGCIFLFFCLLNTGLTYHEYISVIDTDYLFFDNRKLFPIVAAGASFFALASTIRFGKKASQVIVELGNLTFGIYLVSDLFIEHLWPVYNKLISCGIYPMVAMLMFEVLIFLGGASVTFILKRIPLLKKLV